MAGQSYPDGCAITVSPDGIMTVTIDLNKDIGPSSTGKTTMLATTHGNLRKDAAGYGATYISMNVYRYPTERDRNRARNEDDERWAR
jgi:hypothetical protein